MAPSDYLVASGKGTVFSFVVHHAPKVPGRTLPFVIALVELEEGVRSVAAPIHDRSGRVVAAVNVSTHAARATTDAIREQMLPPLLDTARAIEADLAVSTPTAISG